MPLIKPCRFPTLNLQGTQSAPRGGGACFIYFSLFPSNPNLSLYLGPASPTLTLRDPTTISSLCTCIYPHYFMSPLDYSFEPVPLLFSLSGDSPAASHKGLPCMLGLCRFCIHTHTHTLFSKYIWVCKCFYRVVYQTPLFFFIYHFFFFSSFFLCATERNYY